MYELDAVVNGTRSANSVSLRVGPLSEHRILLFVDAHYPGWRAMVDGQETEILLANDVFKAVELGPGTHQVSFTYSSGRVLMGVGISLTTLMFLRVPNSPLYFHHAANGVPSALATSSFWRRNFVRIGAPASSARKSGGCF
jgi:membrane protein YfhO